MTIEKLEEFASNGDKHLTGLDVATGFPRADKPERPWFNKLFGDITKKTNELINYRNSDEETKLIASSGFVIVDSFELGATITQRNQALRHTADGKLYRWAGDLPKVVPASSTPTNAGGFGTNAWLEVSDTALRQSLQTQGGDIVGTATGLSLDKAIIHKIKTVANLKALLYPLNTVWLSGYHTENDGAFGSLFFKWDASSTLSDNGGTVLAIASQATGRYLLQCGDMVSPRWFGAVGDGVVDDTTAVQAAFLSFWDVDGQGYMYRLKGQVGLRANNFYTGNKQTIVNCKFVLDYAAYPVITSYASIGRELEPNDLFAGAVTFRDCVFTEASKSVAINLDRIYNSTFDGCTISNIHRFGVSNVDRPPLPGGYSQSLRVVNCHINSVGNKVADGGGFLKANVAINWDISNNYFEYNLGLILDIAISGQSIRVNSNSIEGGSSMMRLWNTTGSIRDNYFENVQTMQSTAEGRFYEIYINETLSSVQATSLDIIGNRFHTASASINDVNFSPIHCGKAAINKVWNIRCENNYITRATSLSHNDRPIITCELGQFRYVSRNHSVKTPQRTQLEEDNSVYTIEGNTYYKNIRVNVANKKTTKIFFQLKGIVSLDIEINLLSENTLNVLKVSTSVAGYANTQLVPEEVVVSDPTSNITASAYAVSAGLICVEISSPTLFFRGEVVVSGYADSSVVGVSGARNIFTSQDAAYITNTVEDTPIVAG